MSILIYRNNEQFGPYSEEEASQHLESGALSREDLAWREGMEQWVPLHELIPSQEALVSEVPVPTPTLSTAPETVAGASSEVFRNPYSPPESDSKEFTVQEIEVVEYAEGGKRFLNYLIDYFAVIGCGFVVGVVVAILFGDDAIEVIESVPETVLGLILFFGYYTFTEGIWNRSLGKLITGTKVVQEDGSRPTFAQIMGRTLCRFIPFEAFSFLGSGPGWHDSISNRRVIKTR